MTDLYRYFSLRYGPFCARRVFDDPDRFGEVFPGCRFDTGYPELRERTEAELRRLFLMKGGRPETEHPYYMVLGNCDRWFKGEKGFRASICIPLEDFDPSCVSFTYGDSIPVMNGMVSGEYAGELYTLDGILELVQRIGLPQDWNQLCEHGPECYIEAQIWSERPFRKYMDAYADEDLIGHAEALVDAAIGARPDLWPARGGIGVREALGLILGDVNRAVLLNRLGSLDSRSYEDNRVHGIMHAFRCTVYCIILCILRGYDIRKTLLAVDAVANHDIGRLVDRRDHGRTGADLFRDTHPYYDLDALPVVMAAIHAHPCREEEVAEVLRGYGFDRDDGLAAEMAALVRDCDALDYVRLGLEGYNIRYVVAEDSRHLVRFAMCLNLMMWRYPSQTRTLFRRMFR